MRRARGRNTSGESTRKKQQYNYEDINVPEILKNSGAHSGNGTAVRKGTKPSTKKKGRNNKKKKKHTPLKAILIIILLAVAAFMFLMGRSLSGGDAEGALIPVDMEKGKLNVLLLGVDKEGLRTDAMMLVSYDLKNPGAKLLSIPRDTQIKVQDRKVTRKINEVHAMHDNDGKLIGPMGSIRAVESLTGVPIHYYLEMNFDAIDELANLVGPIEFDVPDIEGKGQGMNYDDPTQELHIHLKPGLQKLSGNQVQQFLRYRKSNNGTKDGSDISRVERQQEFIKAAVEQKVNIGLITKVPSIYSKLKKNMKTNFSVGDAVKYSKYLKDLKSENIHSFSLPGESKRLKAWYFICDFSETKTLIETEFDYQVDNLTNVISLSDLKGTKKVLSSSEKKNAESEKPTSEPTAGTSSNKSGSKNQSTSEEDGEEFTNYDEYENKSGGKTDKTNKGNSSAADKSTDKKDDIIITPKPKNTETPKADSEATKAPQSTAGSEDYGTDDDYYTEDDEYINLDE